MVSWIPIVLVVFACLPPRRAVLVSSLAAWLFLPGVAFDLPGLPDYTKSSATAVGLVLGMALFDPGRLLGMRPRWYDLPVIIWCVSPFVTSMTNHLGAYDGVSAVIVQLFRWGLPYLVGRGYFDDLDGLRALAIGIVVGGLIYVPLCLCEIRLSPFISFYLYGVDTWGWEGMRYGGYRPRVFMYTGLELGMWMTAASLSGCWLWASGSLRQLRGYPFGMLLGILLVTTVLCKSTGALLLLLLGLAIYGALKRKGWAWPVWVLLALPLVYEGLRTSKLWSGHQAVEVTQALINAERAESLDFRLRNEDLLVEKALGRPFFGWGGWNRARVFNEQGRDLTTTDGYWIICLGNQGLVGLGMMNATLLLPLFLLIRRIPPRSWPDPRFSAAAVLAVLLGLYMLDNLSNAMLNPIYPLAIGGLTALDPGRIGKRSGMEDGDGPTSGDGPGPDPEEADVEADPRPAREAEVLDPRHRLAEGQRVRAGQLAIAGRPDAAEELLRRAARMQEALVRDDPATGVYRQGLARTCIYLGRFLADRGRRRETQRAWRRALELLAGLADEFPERPEYREGWLDHLNNFAWLLATASDPAVRDPSRAVSWAATAVEQAPECSIYWNTLGVARYRAGNDRGAIEALGRSVELGSGGTSFDHFHLSLALARCGDQAMARTWYHRGVAWMGEHRPRQEALSRLRDEAASLLADFAPRPAVGQLALSPATSRPETGPPGPDDRGPPPAGSSADERTGIRGVGP
jgi:tetratricopeptide (TPR) repeat protein